MANTTDPKKRTKSQPGSSGTDYKKEQRKHKRVDFFNPVKVVVPSDNTSIDVFAANVSKGGMFIRSNQPLSPGKKMRLTFSTNKGPVQVNEAEVRWAKRFEPISVDGSPPGMGVEFRAIGDDSLENISAFINEIIGQDSPESSIPRPSDPQTEPALPAVAPMASPANSPIKNEEQERISSTATPAPTPEKEQDHGSEEDMAAAFSTPPPTRARMLLFVGFVLVVAVLTFLTLMWIKPFDRGSQKTTLTPVTHDKQKHVEVSAVESETKPQDTRQAKEDENQEAGKQKNAASSHSVTSPTQKTKPGKDSEDQPGNIALTNNTGKDASAEKTKTPVGPKAAGQENVTSPKIYPPKFSKTDDGWKMTINAEVTVHSKHFSLKSPPRLALDIKGAKWIGQAQIQNPAPFVSRIRIGKQPDFVRFVLDFKSGQVPRYKVEKNQKSLVVRFPGMK